MWHSCQPLPVSLCLRPTSNLNHRELFKCQQTNVFSKQRAVCVGQPVPRGAEVQRKEMSGLGQMASGKHKVGARPPPMPPSSTPVGRASYHGQSVSEAGGGLEHTT